MPATTRSAASGRAKSPRPLLSARVSSPRRSYRSRSPNASQHSQRGDSAPSGGAASAAMTPFAGLLSTISGALGAVTDAAGGADGLAETQHWLLSGGGSRGSSSAQPASTANGRHAQTPPVRVEPGLGLVYTPRKYRCASAALGAGAPRVARARAPAGDAKGRPARFDVGDATRAAPQARPVLLPGRERLRTPRLSAGPRRRRADRDPAGAAGTPRARATPGRRAHSPCMPVRCRLCALTSVAHRRHLATRVSTSWVLQ